MPGCFSFWPFSRSPAVKLPEDLEPGTPLYVKGCVFCDVSKENGFNVVYEDEDYVAFKDRSPSSLHHVQLIPKTHIGSVKDLRKSDVVLVQTMSSLGNTILDQLDANPDPNSRKMGFHIPPYNSVNHLHLHLQGLPYKSRLRQWKYPVAQGDATHIKGFSWFVTAEQTIRILESGRRVGVLAVER